MSNNVPTKDFKAELQASLDKIKASKATPAKPSTQSSKKVIKKAIQADVDAYIKKDAEYKALEKELKAMRARIEPYMIENGIDIIMGSENGRIERVPTNRAIISAKYTSYSVYDIRRMLKSKPHILKEVIVEAVDKDMIDLYVKTGKIDKEVQGLKLLNESTNFSAKQI